MRYLCSICGPNSKMNSYSILFVGIFFIVTGIILYVIAGNFIAMVISVCAGVLNVIIGASSVWMFKKAVNANIDDFFEMEAKFYMYDNAVFLEMDPNKRN